MMKFCRFVVLYVYKRLVAFCWRCKPVLFHSTGQKRIDSYIDFPISLDPVWVVSELILARQFIAYCHVNGHGLNSITEKIISYLDAY